MAAMTTRRSALVILAISLVLMLVVFVAWCAWELHFWTPPGRTTQIGAWRFQSYEFEVWQIKNDNVVEAFSTGLFVRKANVEWHCHSIGFQDDYHVPIKLKESGAKIEVYRNGRLVGRFDTMTGRYLRPGQTVYINGGTTSSPEKWCVSPAVGNQ